MEFVLGPEAAHHHERLVRLFVRARVLRGEPLIGVRAGEHLAAAGIASFPDSGPAPEAFQALREETWRLLGAGAERRYTAYGEATAPFAFPPGSVHLNMVGARRSRQRMGFGRRIIDAVQEISRARAGSSGVSLTTERFANVAYYAGLGFELVGHVRCAPGLESWGFFRRDDNRS
jgi:ribosomal protein S18 acetylase RimI-like enzyme